MPASSSLASARHHEPNQVIQARRGESRLAAGRRRRRHAYAGYIRCYIRCYIGCYIGCRPRVPLPLRALAMLLLRPIPRPPAPFDLFGRVTALSARPPLTPRHAGSRPVPSVGLSSPGGATRLHFVCPGPRLMPAPDAIADWETVRRSHGLRLNAAGREKEEEDEARRGRDCVGRVAVDGNARLCLEVGWAI